MKKLFTFNTRTIVATGIGAALFTLLFMYVKIPTGIPETQIQSAYGVGGFFAAMFGPIAGFLIAFIGHAISDSVQYGSAWWSWVIASGVSCLVIGLCYPKLKVDEGEFGKGDIIRYNIYQIIGNAVAWIVVAPVLDIVIYAEPVNLVFTHVSLNDFYKRCIMQVVLNCLVCLLCLIDKSIVINFVVPYMVVI